MTYTVRDLYSDLPGHGPAGHGDRWLYPIVVELDGAKPGDPDGLAMRSRVVTLDYDDDRGLAIVRVES